MPRHDRIEPEWAGEGWTAHIAFRGRKIVGVVVVPTDARSVPDRFDPRMLSVADARMRAAESDGLDPEVISKLVQGAQSHLSGRSLYWWVAFLVLQAQAERRPRYTFVAGALEDLGVDLGRDREGKVKNLIRRATDAGFLAKAGSGRGPRVAGKNFEKGASREISMVRHPSESGTETNRKLAARFLGADED